MARHALILAGGRGTRFWPKSRTATPKQLLPFLGDRSLLQETVSRLEPVVPPERIWVLTSELLRESVQAQLPGVPARQIIAEPAQRNTAPCLGLAARLVGELDSDAVLGVFPADHHIEQPDAFLRYVRSAYDAAEGGRLITLGIQPRWAETGFGYLEFPEGTNAGGSEAVVLQRFREKPDADTARKFVAEGRFFWNAGMFFWRADRFASELRAYLPQTAALLDSLPPWTDPGFGSSLADVYPQCEDISVDFAVMEGAAKAGVVAGIPTGDFGWNDLGSWTAVHELADHDAAGNATRGDVMLQDAVGCYVDAGGKLVALVGVKDLVVVETEDALLVTTRDRAQEVGKVVKRLEALKRSSLI